MLNTDLPGNIHRGTMWCYVLDRHTVLFDYTPTAEGEPGPWRVLRGREGYVQADAASVFDRVYNGRVGRATEVGSGSCRQGRA